MKNIKKDYWYYNTSWDTKDKGKIKIKYKIK